MKQLCILGTLLLTASISGRGAGFQNLNFEAGEPTKFQPKPDQELYEYIAAQTVPAWHVHRFGLGRLSIGFNDLRLVGGLEGAMYSCSLISDDFVRIKDGTISPCLIGGRFAYYAEWGQLGPVESAAAISQVGAIPLKTKYCQFKLAGTVWVFVDGVDVTSRMTRRLLSRGRATDSNVTHDLYGVNLTDVYRARIDISEFSGRTVELRFALPSFNVGGILGGLTFGIDDIEFISTDQIEIEAESLKAENGSISFHWTGPAGAAFQVQSATNIAGTWLATGPVVTSTNQVFSYSETNRLDTVPAQHFYRVLKVP